MTFGTLQNVSVSLKEMMHGVYKKVIPHTNKKNVEFDLIRRDNILQGLRNIIDNGYDQRFPEGNNSYIRSYERQQINMLVRRMVYICSGSSYNKYG